MTETDTTAAVKNKRRSKRVVLIVPIVVSLTTSDGRIANEQAKTQVVNAHGGLLLGRFHVIAGQEIVLTNRAGATRRCKVVRTEQTASENLAVAFQFEEPAPYFWPISFPPEDWASGAQA
ncbi:MAG TPA: hypothetical protein VGH83_11000 [Candidatus Acidoferrum sp.]|jgi:hypothetical protein